MRTLLLLSLLASGCMDWDRFSEKYGDDFSATLTDLSMFDATDGKPPCDAEICDDFEGPELATRWTSVPPRGGLVALDTERAHSGRQSVKVTVFAANAGTSIAVGIGETETFASAPRSFYARAYFSNAGAVDQNYGLISVTTNEGAYAGLGLEVSPALEFVDWANGDEKNGTTVDRKSSIVLSTNGWSCVEWQVNEGDPGVTNGSSVTWVDDKDVGTAFDTQADVTQPSSHPLAYLSFGLGAGAGTAKATNGATLWIDDVVVSRTRIGCGD